jgi:hypothetical protein
VPAPDFRFSMTLAGGSADGPVRQIVVDVVRGVLAHAGLTGEAGERLLDQVMQERRASKSADCILRFAAHAGELEITLSQSGRDWHTTCPVAVR